VIVPNEERYANLLEEATWKQKIYSLTKMKSKLMYIPWEKSNDEEISFDQWDAFDNKFYT
jgi:hypothetical protein